MDQYQYSLANTKHNSQSFACLVFNKHNRSVDTEIVKIRREKLRLWFSVRPIPEKEKSYISQLINGKASFGEKAARRLEKTYGMGEKYLDTDTTDQEVIEKIQESKPVILDLSALPVEREEFMRRLYEKVSTQSDEEFLANARLYDAADNVARVGKKLHRKKKENK